MAARLHDGWITVPFGGRDLDRVDIAVGATDAWTPAFKDWQDGQRVARIRPPGLPGRHRVWLRVNGHVTAAGRVAL